MPKVRNSDVNEYGGPPRPYREPTNPDIKYLNKTLGTEETKELCASFNNPAAQFCLAACVYVPRQEGDRFDPSYWAEEYRAAADDKSRDDVLINMLKSHHEKTQLSMHDKVQAYALLDDIKGMLKGNTPRESFVVDRIEQFYTRNLPPRPSWGERFQEQKISSKVNFAFGFNLGKGQDPGILGILSIIIDYVNKDLEDLSRTVGRNTGGD